jgi:hypothetical protein
MLIWLSESRISDWFSEVSLIRDNQGKRTVWLSKGLIIKCVVYNESIKEEVKRRLIYEYRCDEKLKTKNEKSTWLVDTGLVVELEHLKTKTRLIDEKLASVRGECET